jgi:hypothetical protein
LTKTFLLDALGNRVPHHVDFGLRALTPLEEEILTTLALGMSATGITWSKNSGLPLID